jgi:AraC-like DNA-binding protein
VKEVPSRRWSVVSPGGILWGVTTDDHDTTQPDRPGAAITIRSAAYRERGLDYAVAPHVNNNYQWYVVIKGNVDMAIGDIPHPLDPWDSVLVPPRAVRSPRCRDEAPGYFYVVFENHRLKLDDLAGRVLTPPAELRPELRELAAELRQASCANTEELVEALAVRILIGLQRVLTGDQRPHEEETATSSAHAHEKVTRVEAFMRRNLDRPLTREDFAEVVHLSPAHLARIFRAVSGKTMLKRLTELRMAAARELLAESTMPVTEIALEVGYSSFSHFSSAFRKHMGLSPSEFRAR